MGPRAPAAGGVGRTGTGDRVACATRGVAVVAPVRRRDSARPRCDRGGLPGSGMSHRTLVADRLVVGYERGRWVLDGASLVVPAGRRLAILGANGSGKTTLLRCLSGALRPSTGAVLVDGVALSHDRNGLRAHRQEVQLVLQNPDDQLFSASVAQDVSFGPMNLGLPEESVRLRVAEALRLLAVDSLAARPTHHLSYGERKRVAIAGAVAMRPCVLLLDEPTAGLDPSAVTEALAALTRLQEADATVVMSTHDVDL